MKAKRWLKKSIQTHNTNTSTSRNNGLIRNFNLQTQLDAHLVSKINTIQNHEIFRFNQELT